MEGKQIHSDDPVSHHSEMDCRGRTLIHPMHHVVRLEVYPQKGDHGIGTRQAAAFRTGPFFRWFFQGCHKAGGL